MSRLNLVSITGKIGNPRKHGHSVFHNNFFLKIRRFSVGYHYPTDITNEKNSPAAGYRKMRNQIHKKLQLFSQIDF